MVSEKIDFFIAMIELQWMDRAVPSSMAFFTQIAAARFSGIFRFDKSVG
jgi:hypothetical protein